VGGLRAATSLTRLWDEQDRLRRTICSPRSTSWFTEGFDTADLTKAKRLLDKLPNPKLRHPCPDWRFDVMTRDGSPAR
jgi:hypothetical protein